MSKKKASDNTEVLSYKIDTAEFDKGMEKVIAALEKVEQREYLTNLQTAVNGIATGLDGVNFNNIESGVAGIEDQFSSWGIVAMSVINNITNGVMNLANNLIFDNLLSNAINGFQELNLQINSTQTILANTGDRFGTTLKEVDEALDGLNNYADKTIYNFSNMTQAVGAFTSAGVDLGNSVQAIKGIANMSAYAGAGAEAASSGMYQFSNALSMGYMMLYQWNSLIYSGLGTKQLEQELISSARGLGIDIDTILKQYGGSFKYSLEAGWADSKVLMHTIAKYSGEITEDQLRKMKYSEEEIQRIIKLGKTATDSATKVISYEKLISSLNESIGSGWARTFKILVGDFEQGKALFTMISDNLLMVIERSANNRNRLVEEWSKLGGRDIIVQSIEKLLKTYNQLMIVVGQAINQVFPPITGKKIFEVTKLLGRFVDALIPTAKGFSNIDKIVRGFLSAVDIPIMFFKALIKYLMLVIGPLDLFKLGWVDSIVGIANFMIKLRKELKTGDVFFKKIVMWGDSFKVFLNKIRSFFEDLKQLRAVQKMRELFDALTLKVGIKDPKFLGNFLNSVKESFKSLFKSFDNDKAFDTINKFIETIMDFGKRVYRVLEPVVLFALELVKNFALTFSNAFKDLATDFSWDKLMDVFNLLSKFVLLKSATDIIQKFGFAMELVKTLSMGFAQTLGSTWTLLKQMVSLNDAEILKTTAISIGILAASVWLLATIPADDLAKGIGAISMIYTILAGSLKSLQAIMSSAAGFVDLLLIPPIVISMALAITILADALLKFEGVDFIDIVKGFTALIGIMGALTLFLKANALSGSLSLSNGLGFIALALSLKILAGSLTLFASIDYESIKKAALAVGSMMLMIGLLSKSGAIGPKLLILAVSLTGIAGSLVVLGLAFKYLGTLEYPTIVSGLQNLIVMIGALYGALAIGNSFTGTGIAKIGLFGLVVAGLAGAFYLLTKLDPLTIVKVSGAVGLSIAGLALVIGTLNPAMLQSIGVLAVLAVGISGFALALQLFNNVDFKAVLLGGIALGAFVLAVVGIGAVITPILPAVAAFAVVLIAITASMVLFGAGVLLFASGIRLLAEAMQIYVKTIDLFLETLTRTLPKFSDVMVKIFQSVSDTAVRVIPLVTNIAAVIIVAMATALIASAPVVGEALIAVLSTVINMLLVLGPQLNNLLFTLVKDALTHLDANVDTFVMQWMSIQTKFLNGLAANIGPVIDALFAYIIAVIRGLRKAVDDKGPLLRAELKKLALALIKFFIDGLFDATDVVDKGFEAFAAYVNSAAAKKLYERRDKIMAIGLNFVKGIIAGLTSSSAIQLLQRGATTIADILLNKTRAGLDEHSPSKEGEEIGSFYTQGIANGLDPSMFDKKLSAIKDALLSFMNGTISSELNLQPTISPVLDMSALDRINQTIAAAFGQSELNLATVGQFSSTGSGYYAPADDSSDRGTTYNYNQTISTTQPLSVEELARRSKTLLANAAKKTDKKD